MSNHPYTHTGHHGYPNRTVGFSGASSENQNIEHRLDFMQQDAQGMRSTEAAERSAMVAEVHDMVFGLVVDGVSDILTVRADQVSPFLKSPRPPIGTLPKTCTKTG